MMQKRRKGFDPFLRKARKRARTESLCLALQYGQIGRTFDGSFVHGGLDVLVGVSEFFHDVLGGRSQLVGGDQCCGFGNLELNGGSRAPFTAGGVRNLCNVFIHQGVFVLVDIERRLGGLAGHVVFGEHLQKLFAGELREALVENLDDFRCEAFIVDGLADGIVGMVGQVVAADQMHDTRPIAVILGEAEDDPFVIFGVEDVIQGVVNFETALRVGVAVLS